jgi:iron complex transport system ATP-binding protein
MERAAIGPRLLGVNLFADYGGGAVLQGVYLAVRSGAMTVLVGPNGSGKSTLLKTLARIVVPSGGEVRLDGQPIRSIPTRDVARRLALLPQGPVAPEGRRVRELVAQGRSPHQTFLRQWSAAGTRAVDDAPGLTARIPLRTGRSTAFWAGKGSAPGSPWCSRRKPI